MQEKVAGKVLKLFISQKEFEQRIPKESISLTHEGVCEDKFYGKDVDRSVLITSKESYDLVQKEGIALQHGQLGENILVDFNPYILEIGQQLMIGSTLLEISQPCSLCKGLTKINNKLPKLLKHDRGIFAQVVEAGVIKKNDSIYLL